MTVNGQFFENFREIFLHRLSGALELPQAGSPYPGDFFSAPAERGTRTALACSPLTGGEFFQHRLTGVRELRKRVRPDGAAPFLHRLSGAHELRQRVRPFRAAVFSAPAERGRELRERVRPFRAESFSLNLSGGDSPSADGGDVAAPAAGRCGTRRRGKKEGTPTGSLPL